MKRLSSKLVRVPDLSNWPTVSVQPTDLSKMSTPRLNSLYKRMWDEIVGLRAEYSMLGDAAMEKGQTTSRPMKKVEKVMDVVWDCMKACEELLQDRDPSFEPKSRTGSLKSARCKMRRIASSDDSFYWSGFEGNPVLQTFFDEVVDNLIPKRLSTVGISSADDINELSYLVEEIIEDTFDELHDRTVPLLKKRFPTLIYDVPVELIARTQEENSETVDDAFWFLITRFLKVQFMHYLEGMLGQ